MANTPIFAYVGTYTQKYGHVDGKGKGIYVFAYNRSDGSLEPVSVAAPVVDPAYLTIAPNRRYLYSVNESSELDGVPGGGVSAFAIDRASGNLTFLNRQPAHGAFPCFVAVDATSALVAVVNHDGGNTVSYPIEADGSLGPVSSNIPHVGPSAQPDHQSPAHPHSVNMDSRNRFAVVCDKGLDRIYVYRLDLAQWSLVPNDPPFLDITSGTSARHLAFHPSERFAYITNEVGSTVTALSFDGDNGVFREIHTLSTVPSGFSAPNHTADIRVHPNGKFVYLTNRGHDSVARFAIDDTTGRLTALGHTPIHGWSRNIRFDPAGRLLLVSHQNADTIVPYDVDPDNGGLRPTGAVTRTPTPVCIEFLVP